MGVCTEYVCRVSFLGLGSGFARVALITLAVACGLSRACCSLSFFSFGPTPVGASKICRWASLEDANSQAGSRGFLVVVPVVTLVEDEVVLQHRHPSACRRRAEAAAAVVRAVAAAQRKEEQARNGRGLSVSRAVNSIS